MQRNNVDMRNAPKAVDKNNGVTKEWRSDEQVLILYQKRGKIG